MNDILIGSAKAALETMIPGFAPDRDSAMLVEGKGESGGVEAISVTFSGYWRNPEMSFDPMADEFPAPEPRTYTVHLKASGISCDRMDF